jgi:hypothetical protein
MSQDDAKDEKTGKKRFQGDTVPQKEVLASRGNIQHVLGVCDVRLEHMRVVEVEWRVGDGVAFLVHRLNMLLHRLAFSQMAQNLLWMLLVDAFHLSVKTTRKTQKILECCR